MACLNFNVYFFFQLQSQQRQNRRDLTFSWQVKQQSGEKVLFELRLSSLPDEGCGWPKKKLASFFFITLTYELACFIKLFLSLEEEHLGLDHTFLISFQLLILLGTAYFCRCWKNLTQLYPVFIEMTAGSSDGLT